jgi:hypothetical protein
MDELKDKRILGLLMLAVFVYALSRSALAFFPFINNAALRTLLWIGLTIAPFVAVIAVYMVALKRRGQSISFGRQIMMLLSVGVLIATLLGSRTIVSWFERLQGENSILSRILVGLAIGWHGWLFPCLILLFFSLTLFFVSRRTR